MLYLLHDTTGFNPHNVGRDVPKCSQWSLGGYGAMHAAIK